MKQTHYKIKQCCVLQQSVNYPRVLPAAKNAMEASQEQGGSYCTKKTHKKYSSVASFDSQSTHL